MHDFLSALGDDVSSPIRRLAPQTLSVVSAGDMHDFLSALGDDVSSPIRRLAQTALFAVTIWAVLNGERSDALPSHTDDPRLDEQSCSGVTIFLFKEDAFAPPHCVKSSQHISRPSHDDPEATGCT